MNHAYLRWNDLDMVVVVRMWWYWGGCGIVPVAVVRYGLHRVRRLLVCRIGLWIGSVLYRHDRLLLLLLLLMLVRMRVFIFYFWINGWLGRNVGADGDEIGQFTEFEWNRRIRARFFFIFCCCGHLLWLGWTTTGTEYTLLLTPPLLTLLLSVNPLCSHVPFKSGCHPIPQQTTNIQISNPTDFQSWIEIKLD